MSVRTPTNTRPSVEVLRLEARALLGRAAGYRDCPADVLNEMASLGQIRHLKRGEFLARRGDTEVHYGMVVQGLLESSVLRADGQRHLLGLLLPGGFTGLVSLGDRQGRSPHDVSARSEASVLDIPCDAMYRLREREPSLVRANEVQLTQRMVLLFERLSAEQAPSLEARAASMLQTLATLYGRAQGEHIVLDVKLSQADLADWLGVTRQSVNIALKQLESAQLIVLGYQSITIIDPGTLARKAYA